MNSEDRCPHCGKGILLNWHELDDEQLEVVKRLPGSADYASGVRKARHRWCPRCWFESIESDPREA
jgi:ribosomal protein S27AE